MNRLWDFSFKFLPDSMNFWRVPFSTLNELLRFFLVYTSWILFLFFDRDLVGSSSATGYLSRSMAEPLLLRGEII